MVKGRCMKCKTDREMKDPVQVATKKGTPMVKGTCPVCGTKMARMGKMGKGEDDVLGGQAGLSTMDTSGAVFVEGGCSRCGGRSRSRKSRKSAKKQSRKSGKKRSRKSRK